MNGLTDGIQGSSRNIFLRKTTIQSDPVLTFRNRPVIKTSHPKHFRLILDDSLNCKENLKQEITQAYKGNDASQKL